MNLEIYFNFQTGLSLFFIKALVELVQTVDKQVKDNFQTFQEEFNKFHKANEEKGTGPEWT